MAVRLLEVAAGHGIHDSAEPPSSRDWPRPSGRRGSSCLTVERGRRVLLDAAHNPEGARALAAYLTRWHPERPPLVIGVMRDKNVADIAHALLPVVSSVIATAAPTPRAIPATDLARHLRAAGAQDVRSEPDPILAIEKAFESAETICVAGSIFLAGAVRDELRQRAILH